MKKSAATLIVLILVIVVGFVIGNYATAKPAEALNNCYIESQRHLTEYQKDTTPQSCQNAKSEVETLTMCRNNVYAQYGKPMSYLAKKKLFATTTDPYDNILSQHNTSCPDYKFEPKQ